MFGVPLETLMGDEGGDDLMPAVVADCVDYLRASGAPRKYQGVI
jgi:hypothetical protein